MKASIQRLYYNYNHFFYIYKTWRNDPIQYYHAHEGVEFLYIHEGSGRLILEDRQYTLYPRSLVFFQPYQLHLIQYDKPYLRSIIKVKPSLLEQYASTFPDLSDFCSFIVNSKVGQQVFQLDGPEDAELTFQLKLLKDTLQIVPRNDSNELFHLSFLNLLSYLKTRVFHTVNCSENIYNPRHTHHVETIQQWVAQHFRKPFDLNKLATDLHLSASYLSNLFKQCTGMTITEYITKKRLDEACLQLQTTTLPMDQVGKNSGFSNAAYFSRSFKKHFGLTPLQFRIKSSQPFGTVKPSHFP